MGKIKTLYFFAIVFFCSLCFSQSRLTGVIQTLDGQIAISASVILKNEKGSIISYIYTNELGKYILETTQTGNFTLSANAMGFELKTVAVNLEKENETKIIDFVLKSKTTELNEVIIQKERAITVKRDTVDFLAKSFLQGNEQVVEDLLKKIPGFNIDNNGTIKIGNQEIEKVMIDGDDMFARGYKILTKNMPVAPIEKVQLLQNYSNNKLLKGIENSQKVAINLTLKEDYKRQWFGNATLGYGLVSENRYENRGNLMNFGKKSKYYFLTNLNNIGADATGDIENLIRPFNFDEPGSIGDNQSANKLMGFGGDSPNLKQKRVNFNNAEMLSLNSIFTLSTKVKVKLLGFFNTDEQDFFRNSTQSFNAGNTTFQNNEDFIGRKKQFTGFGKIDLNYDISKTKMFEYSGKFNKTNENNRSDLFFNGDFLSEKLNSNNQLFDQKIVFTNKISEQNVFLLSGRYINEKTPQNYTVNQFISASLFNQNADNTAQRSENKMQFAGAEAHFLNKKTNGDLLELKLGNQLRTDNLATQFELLNGSNSLLSPTGYQNNLTYTTNDLYLSAKYRFNFNKITLLTGSDFHQLLNRLENLNVKKTQNSFFINSKVGLDWKINEKNKITTSYSYNTTNAGVLDVYSGFVQTGFRSFSKGLETFNQLESSTALINYTLGNWGDKFFANTFILYTKNNDFFSTNSIIAQNVQQSEKIIIQDREFVTIATNMDRYFKTIKSNLKITISGSKSNFKNVVNNSDLREVKQFNGEYGAELRSGFRGLFNYHIGSKWNYNQVQTTIENSFTNNISFVDLSLMFSDKFNIQIQSERYFFGNLDSSNNKYYFLDLEGRWTVKENKLSFSLSGNNLLNTNTFIDFAISDTGTSTTAYRLLPRYVLLKMEFRF